MTRIKPTLIATPIKRRRSGFFFVPLAARPIPGPALASPALASPALAAPALATPGLGPPDVALSGASGPELSTASATRPLCRAPRAAASLHAGNFRRVRPPPPIWSSFLNPLEAGRPGLPPETGPAGTDGRDCGPVRHPVRSPRGRVRRSRATGPEDVKTVRRVQQPRGRAGHTRFPVLPDQSACYRVDSHHPVVVVVVE